jgi:hypothetical protein
MGTFAETAIVACRLSFADQEKQTSVYRSVCSKQTEVCRFHFLFATTNRNLPFFVRVPFFRLRNWKHGDRVDMRHGNLEKWRHGQGDMDMETGT